jgi:hypothetical protein
LSRVVPSLPKAIAEDCNAVIERQVSKNQCLSTIFISFGITMWRRVEKDKNRMI